MRLRRLTDLPIMIPWVLCAGLILLVVLRWHPKPAPILKPETVERIDSLRKTGIADQKLRDSLRADAAEKAAQADSAARRARVASNAAAVERTRADSLARKAASEANTAEEARLWKAAYFARTAEADSLWRAGRNYEIAYTTEREARIAAETVTANAELRIKAIEQVNRSMYAEFQKYQRKQDKLFGRIPLPSRKVVGVIGLTLGSVVTLAAK